MLRILIFAITAIGGGLALGRRALDRQIERRVSSEIADAQARAVEELEKRLDDVIKEKLVHFAINIAIKAALIGAAYVLYLAQMLNAHWLAVVTIALVAIFVTRDVLVSLPFIAPAIGHARRHGWNLRRALREFIAGVIFERAYAEALAQTEQGPNKLIIALSKHSRRSISEEVANAVADVARTTSFARARARAGVAALLAAAMVAIYSAFLLATIGAA